MYIFCKFTFHLLKTIPLHNIRMPLVIIVLSSVKLKMGREDCFVFSYEADSLGQLVGQLTVPLMTKYINCFYSWASLLHR